MWNLWMLKLVPYKVTIETRSVNDYALPGHILYIVLFSIPHTTFLETL